MHKHIKEIKQMTALLEKGYPIEGMVRWRKGFIYTWTYSATDCVPLFCENYEWQSALARVEDKYVFGDEENIYWKDGGKVNWHTPPINNADLYWNFNYMTWSPPKPAIVMVPLLREDAEWCAEQGYIFPEHIRIQDACKEALK